MVKNKKKEADFKSLLYPLLSNSIKKSYFNYYISIFYENQLQRWDNQGNFIDYDKIVIFPINRNRLLSS